MLFSSLSFHTLSLRPFSNIEEDVDDIECDNPECPEEIQELKQEILSAYQVMTAHSKHPICNHCLISATAEHVRAAAAEEQWKAASKLDLKP